jgi:1-acyl-sn-glycerol-3-phosphate acyltransferase
MLKNGFQFLFSIYGFLVFVTLMFMLLPLFMVSFLMNDVTGGNLLYKIARFWADAFFFLIGLKPLVIAEENRDIRKQYIFVSNHISYLDIPMMLEVIRHQHVRILGKAEMTKVPILGYIYKRGAVLVHRDNREKRSESVQNLIDFINKDIGVFICPEGTFNLTHHALKQFYDGAFRIAIETQTPILPILFLDTYDRLNYKSIFSLNPGKCRAVYLRETLTAGLSAEDLPMLKEKIFRQMEDGLIRYKASWIR